MKTTTTDSKGKIGVERWMGHSRMSDPASHAARIADLLREVGALNRVVQGLLIHVDWLSAYGVAADQVRSHARATLPMADRLAEIIDADPRPLLVPRLPKLRSVATCRDFALMTTSFLRCKGVPARLRCGFASYLGGGCEDHWVCEYWHESSRAWRLCDPQIDEVMSARLAIEFDPANVPRTSFLTAGEAWLDCRAGRSDPRRFGHGEATGVWFLRLNVFRDHFALNGAETSAWDDWRAAPPATRVVSRSGMELADVLAAHPEAELSEARPDWLEPAAHAP
jgi:Transglutaminase-like superfamily